MTVECEHVYLSIGQSILWGDLLAGSKVELGRGNGAVADPLTYQTAEPDIFVGGDVYTGPSFAINAIAAGKEGAESIHRFVHENASMTIGRNRRQFIELDKEILPWKDMTMQRDSVLQWMTRLMRTDHSAMHTEH